MENVVSVVVDPARRLTARDYKTLCLSTLGGLSWNSMISLSSFSLRTQLESDFSRPKSRIGFGNSRLSAYSLPVISPDHWVV